MLEVLQLSAVLLLLLHLLLLAWPLAAAAWELPAAQLMLLEQRLSSSPHLLCCACLQEQQQLLVQAQAQLQALALAAGGSHRCPLRMQMQETVHKLAQSRHRRHQHHQKLPQTHLGLHKQLMMHSHLQAHSC
jgi:hypothetical protein